MAKRDTTSIQISFRLGGEYVDAARALEVLATRDGVTVHEAARQILIERLLGGDATEARPSQAAPSESESGSLKEVRSMIQTANEALRADQARAVKDLRTDIALLFKVVLVDAMKVSEADASAFIKRVLESRGKTT